MDLSCSCADITGLVSAMLIMLDSFDIDRVLFISIHDNDKLIGTLKKDSEGYYYFHPSRKSKYSVIQLKNILLKLIYLNTEYEKN